LDQPVLEEEEISGTNRYMEMQKEGFENTYEPSYVDGKVGWYCNYCKGTQIAFANVFSKRC